MYTAPEIRETQAPFRLFHPPLFLFFRRFGARLGATASFDAWMCVGREVTLLSNDNPCHFLYHSARRQSQPLVSQDFNITFATIKVDIFCIKVYIFCHTRTIKDDILCILVDIFCCRAAELGKRDFAPSGGAFDIYILVSIIVHILCM